MLSDSDFFWGFIFPLILLGFTVATVLFVGLPWLWELIWPYIVDWAQTWKK